MNKSKRSNRTILSFSGILIPAAGIILFQAKQIRILETELVQTRIAKAENTAPSATDPYFPAPAETTAKPARAMV